MIRLVIHTAIVVWIFLFALGVAFSAAIFLITLAAGQRVPQLHAATLITTLVQAVFAFCYLCPNVRRSIIASVLGFFRDA